MKNQKTERVYHLVSATCSETEFDRLITESQYKMRQAGIKLLRVFLSGLAENGKRVKAFTRRPVTYRSCHKRYLPAKNETVKGVEYHCARIRFFGAVSNAEAVEAQMRATLLVNPRYTDAEYTQYSFPSKNAEYAASGTPTLTTALPGMPEEYRNHVFLLEEETVAGMAKKLRELAGLSREELYERGHEAKAWMLRDKNAKIQLAKIIRFTDTL